MSKDMGFFVYPGMSGKYRRVHPGRSSALSVASVAPPISLSPKKEQIIAAHQSKTRVKLWRAAILHKALSYAASGASESYLRTL